MDINIKIIPHLDQRYDTIGDWWKENGLQIRVSNLGNEVYEWLVAEHEINEYFKCKALGISEEEVSKFDKEFEALRLANPILIGEQEPGDMVSAPYHLPHQGATNIEKQSAIFHGVDWNEYEKTLNNI